MDKQEKPKIARVYLWADRVAGWEVCDMYRAGNRGFVSWHPTQADMWLLTETMHKLVAREVFTLRPFRAMACVGWIAERI